MAAKHNSTTIPQDGKHIRYDRETKDYACYLNGEFIGYAPNYSDGETLCEQTYYAQLSHTSAPATEPAPEAEAEAAPVAEVVATPVWRQANGDLSWEAGVSIACFDYAIGEGLTRALIGTHDHDKEGIELIIGGNPINERVEEVITLADVRRLRDNLSTLLADPRVQACQLAAQAV